MPITFVAAKVHPTYDYPPAIPCVQGEAMTAPTPLSLSTQTRADGMPIVVKSNGANNSSYIGYGVIPKSVGDGIGALRATVLAGFAGMTAGAEVYLSAIDGALTHNTQDTVGGTPTANRKIGIALTVNLLYIY